jgi:hypothetical protein
MAELLPGILCICVPIITGVIVVIAFQLDDIINALNGRKAEKKDTEPDWVGF